MGGIISYLRNTRFLFSTELKFLTVPGTPSVLCQRSRWTRHSKSRNNARDTLRMNCNIGECFASAHKFNKLMQLIAAKKIVPFLCQAQGSMQKMIINSFEDFALVLCLSVNYYLYQECISFRLEQLFPCNDLSFNPILSCDPNKSPLSSLSVDQRPT